MTGLFQQLIWLPVPDGNADARALYHRHYSRYVYRDGRQPKKILGPGEYLLLLTPDCTAVFAWRLFIDKCPLAGGLNCAIFRNEGDRLSSELIQEADELAWLRWPKIARHYTYVNPRKVQSRNPGYCFIKAGWHKCGVTAGGLLVFEAFAS